MREQRGRRAPAAGAWTGARPGEAGRGSGVCVGGGGGVDCRVKPKTH